MRWIVGIENAFIPDMGVDQFALTGHRQRWRADLALAVEAGADAMRYGVTWPEVETAPGQYLWTEVDQVFDECSRLGLEPIWDLVHFGVPAHLAGGYLDANFPAALSNYAAAFARRYRGVLGKLTPWNEPYISTYFRAGWGIWPPHLKGREGFAKMLQPVVTGIHGAIKAVNEAAPEMAIWLNDGADSFHPTRPEVADEAAFRTLQRYAAFDILTGLAKPDHETHEWLTAAGFPADALRRLNDDPVNIDVIGLDYYPETEHDFDVDTSGEPVVTTATAPLGLAQTATLYHRRYGRPLFVAESSASGSDGRRRDWIAWNVAEMRRATEAGAEILGYTWWPLFDHIDWNTLLRERTGFVCPAGLYHLQPTKYDRLPTAAVDDFRRAAEADRRPSGDLAATSQTAPRERTRGET